MTRTRYAQTAEAFPYPEDSGLRLVVTPAPGAMLATYIEAPPVITEELQDQLHVAAPLLRLLHAQQSTMNIPALPDDAPVPGALFNLLPYYMNKTDPPQLGVWKVQIGDRTARLHSTPQLGERDAKYQLKMSGEAGPRDATVAEAADFAATLAYVHDGWKQQAAQEAAAERSSTAGHTLARFLRRNR